MLLNWTKNLLEKRAIKPSKRLGQNFLISEQTRMELVAAADIKKNDLVLEVGAGIGTITTELAARAKHVIAVEKDKALIPILKETTKDFKNIEIIQGDILKTCFVFPTFAKASADRHGSCFMVVGNIPYYLTAPLIRKFLESADPPRSMTLMVQKEMAQRICAKPPDMSILAISVQVYAKPHITSYVPRSSFWPAPEVDSAILKIIPVPADSKTNLAKFFRIVKTGFSSPRKQLINNLSKGLKISRAETERVFLSANIDPKRRAETLSVEDWINLVRKF